MKLEHLFIVHSVVALFHGGGFVLAPKLFMSLYGISLADPEATFVARLFGRWAAFPVQAPYLQGAERNEHKSRA